MLLYDPQWTIGNTDTAIDVVLEFERASFDGLAVRAVATEGYRPLPPDDHNMAIVQSVTGGARDVVYRLWRVGDSGSWRIGILDLQRRRLYATKVDVSY